MKRGCGNTRGWVPQERAATGEESRRGVGSAGERRRSVKKAKGAGSQPRPTPRTPATRDGAGPSARHGRHRPLSLRVRPGRRGGPGGPGEQRDPSPTRNVPSRG